jgi:hypothetical protein
MNERMIAIMELMQKQIVRIDAQQANYKRYKARSVFYRGKKDDDRHSHEMQIKKMALSRLGAAYNKCLTQINNQI